MKFYAVCRILQNVVIYAYKCSATAQNGGGVLPIWAMPVFRPFFLKIWLP